MLLEIVTVPPFSPHTHSSTPCKQASVSSMSLRLHLSRSPLYPFGKSNGPLHSHFILSLGNIWHSWQLPSFWNTFISGLLGSVCSFSVAFASSFSWAPGRYLAHIYLHVQRGNPLNTSILSQLWDSALAVSSARILFPSLLHSWFLLSLQVLDKISDLQRGLCWMLSLKMTLNLFFNSVTL